MAKMFYTLNEAAERLKKSAEQVREMAQKGQIQEFRDRDQLMFKTDQIDLLAADEEHGTGDEADLSSMIPLADSGFGLADSTLGESASGASAGGLGESGIGGGDFGESEGLGGLLGESGEMGGSGLLGGSGSGLGSDPFADSGGGSKSGDKKERTGVGIFDADELEEVDPSEMTVMSSSGSGLALDSLGSGSGLMDLTRESDDTSLGADFLEELTPGEEAGASQRPSASSGAGAGGLFEGDDEGPLGAGAGAGAGLTYAVAEPYDGAGSGFVGGLSLGAVVAMALALAIVVLSMLGAPDAGLIDMIASNFIPVFGGLLGLTAILGALGFVIGRRG